MRRVPFLHQTMISSQIQGVKAISMSCIWPAITISLRKFKFRFCYLFCQIATNGAAEKKYPDIVSKTTLNQWWLIRSSPLKEVTTIVGFQGKSNEYSGHCQYPSKAIFIGPLTNGWLLVGYTLCIKSDLIFWNFSSFDSDLGYVQNQLLTCFH